MTTTLSPAYHENDLKETKLQATQIKLITIILFKLTKDTHLQKIFHITRILIFYSLLLSLVFQHNS